MRKIHMCDLNAQYLRMKDEIDGAIAGVISSAQFIKGQAVADFEAALAKYLNAHVIGCGNGTDALQIAYWVLGLAPGDEIITVPFTFVATVEAAVLLGLKPVFVDVNPDTFIMDEHQIESAVGEQTKAIVPVHLFGQCAPMEFIGSVAQEHGLWVVEDVCQALGADYVFRDGRRQKAGTLGHVACNSFFPSKNLGAYGDGGAVITRDDTLAAMVRSVANHGMEKKYCYERIGMNSRLDSIQAAILEVKLRYLEQDLHARQKAALVYDELLADIQEVRIPQRVSHSSHTFHQYTIKAERRDALKDFLAERGVPSMVYYPRPLHLQEAYAYLGYKAGDFPVSESLATEVLSLPMHPDLDEEQQVYIAETIRAFYTLRKS